MKDVRARPSRRYFGIGWFRVIRLPPPPPKKKKVGNIQGSIPIEGDYSTFVFGFQAQVEFKLHGMV